MKTYRISLVVCGLLTAASPLLAAETNSTPSPAPATAAYTVKDIPAADYAPMSAGVADVASLAKSGVSDKVVLSYVKNSPTAYTPSAAEIIQLRDQGVSQDVITAMLDRGGELRAQGVPANTPVPSSSASYVADAPATTTTVVTQPNVVYTEPSSSVVYIGSSYGYPYYPFYWGGYWGPRYYYRGGYYGGYRGGYRGGGGGGLVVHGSGGGGGGFHGGGGGRHR